jgi:hypothetical protein
MADPWVVEELEAKVHFAKSLILRTEQNGQTGHKYYKMQILLTPIEDGVEITDRSFFNFQPAWTKIIIPSVLKLVERGKINTPADMEKDQFVSYRWSEYRNYDKRDLEYWRERDPDKLSVDEQGRSYKSVLGVEYLEVFANEAEWRATYTESNAGQPEQDPMYASAMESLPAVVKACGTDITQLNSRLGYNPLSILGGINAPEVRQALAEYIVGKAGPGDTPEQLEAQKVLLVEINKHFEGGEYLSLDGPEMQRANEMIPF